MRILCSIHGVQKVRQISPDLWASAHEGSQTKNVIQVAYEYGGQVVDGFLLSEEFAKEHKINGGVTTLPNDYPPWTNETTIVCENCFLENNQRRELREVSH